MPEIVVIDADASPAFASTAREANGMAYQVIATPGGGRRFLHVSQGCAALLGVSAEEVMAKPEAFYLLLPLEERRRLAEVEARAIAGGAPMEAEFTMLRADGALRWMRAAAALRDTPEGRVWDGVMVDVTERREVEQKLEQHTRRLELAVESTGMGFWEYDIGAQRLSFAPHTLGLYGWGLDERPDFDAFTARIPPEEMDDIIARFWRMMGDPRDGAFSFEHRVMLAEGRARWLSVHARLVADDAGGPLLVGTALDVTRRRELDERRALVAGEMAHRMKNGLSVVLGILSQSARRARTVDELTEVVSARVRAMGRSQEIIGDNPHRPPDVLALMEAVLGRGLISSEPEAS